jgi:Stress responsive A/B Barrel Domain
MFTWKPETAPDQLQAITEGLARLPGAIEQIRDYHFGPDAKINTGNFDFAVVADFDSREDYLVYRDDETHRSLVADAIAPYIAQRAAVQFEY